MDTIICDVPVTYDLEQVAMVSGVRPESDFAETLAEVGPLFLQYAKPKVVLKWVEIKHGEGDETWVDDVKFESKIVKEMLKNVDKAFVFVVSAGKELEAVPEIESSLLLKESLHMYSLMLAHGYMREFLAENFGYEDPGVLNPGSLPDWPIYNNFAIFDILGPATEEVGVKIMASGYMDPWKSGSGIIFSNAGGYQNCMLCKKIDCIGRRAEFNQAEYDRIFGDAA